MFLGHSRRQRELRELGRSGIKSPSAAEGRSPAPRLTKFRPARRKTVRVLTERLQTLLRGRRSSSWNERRLRSSVSSAARKRAKSRPAGRLTSSATRIPKTTKKSSSTVPTARGENSARLTLGLGAQRPAKAREVRQHVQTSREVESTVPGRRTARGFHLPAPQSTRIARAPRFFADQTRRYRSSSRRAASSRRGHPKRASIVFAPVRATMNCAARSDSIKSSTRVGSLTSISICRSCPQSCRTPSCTLTLARSGQPSRVRQPSCRAFEQ